VSEQRRPIDLSGVVSAVRLDDQVGRAEGSGD
jgi:hypothetical protein